jgi:OOP family OmpA-OmpF porin
MYSVELFVSISGIIKQLQFESFNFWGNIMKTFKLLLGAIALAASCSAVRADSFPEKTGYLIDSRGNVVKNSYGECWRTGYWTPAMAIPECDPGLVEKEKPKEAEPIVSSEAKPPAVVKQSLAVAVAAPERPAVEAYFDAESLFDFDKAVVKPEGRKILDEKIVTGMKMHPEVSLLIITGHADRIGTEKYNQSLSERRANAVKAYLANQGIAAERMTVSGKGESEPNPETNTSQACKGMRGNKLIVCLQPDRRVTIESQRPTPAR